jgi:hypothetical protein
MNNMSANDPHYHRKTRFDQGYRQLAAQGVFAQPKTYSRPSAETWVYVIFALGTNFVSRSFGWLRVFAYWAFLLSIACGVAGVMEFTDRHVAKDLIFAAYLLRSFGMLLKRECTS